MIAQLEAPAVLQMDQPPVIDVVAEIPTEVAHLADVPLRLEAVLDRLTMSMYTVASLDQGSILTLGKAAGENVDLCVGGVKIASGEIVVLEDTLGVRITDILTGE